MIRFLHRLASKGLALTLLAGIAIAAYALVIEPLAAHFGEVRKQIAEQRQLLGRLTTAASQEGQARQSGKLAKSQSGDVIFLKGSSDAVRVAELQSLIGTIAEAEGVTIKSMRAITSREREGVRLLGVETQLSAGIEKLQRILHKLENGRPYLFVDTLQITPQALLSVENPAAGTTLEVRLGLLGIATGKKG